MFICHKNEVCEIRLYVDGYCGLSEADSVVSSVNCVQSAFLLFRNIRRFCCSLYSCRMLIVVMMGMWSDYSECCVVHDVRLYRVLDTLVISGVDVCCSVAFGTMVGVFVFRVIWSELLMPSTISCPLWSSVYECQRVECAFTSPVRTECGIFLVCCMQCCMSVSTVL